MKKETLNMILKRLEASIQGDRSILPQGVTVNFTIDAGGVTVIEGVVAMTLKDEWIEAEDDQGKVSFLPCADVRMVSAEGLGKKSRPGFL